MSLPTFRRQLGDPTTYLDSAICTLEAGAMALDFQTGGEVKVWGGQLIPYCGRDPVEIRDKGTNLQNVALAWSHWGEKLDIRGTSWLRTAPWSEVVSELGKGNAIIAQTDYDRYSLASRCQDSFEANHAVLILPQTRDNGRSILTADPLCSGYRWVPASEHRAAMEKLAQTVRGSTTRLFFAVAHAPVLPPDTATEDDMPGLTVTDLVPFSGSVIVKNDGKKHAAIQVADREYVWLPGGTLKRAIARGRLDPPLDGNPGDRSSVYLIGAEAAVLLAVDVDPKADATDFNSGVTAAAQKALEAKR